MLRFGDPMNHAVVSTSMTSSHAHLWPGVPLALASATLFGASTPFAKLLLVGVDPWLLAGLLYLGAGLGLALVQLAPQPAPTGHGSAAASSPICPGSPPSSPPAELSGRCS